MGMQIDHINRYVSNVDKFIEFYQGVLGYNLIGKGIKQNGFKYAILQGRGHEVFMSEKEGFKPTVENLRHIGYSVDNVELVLEKLNQLGYAESQLKVIVKPYSKQIYIKDPDGMEIDLIQWTDKQGFYKSLMIEKE